MGETGTIGRNDDVIYHGQVHGSSVSEALTLSRAAHVFCYRLDFVATRRALPISVFVQGQAEDSKH
jgi:hypothetical protein